MTAGAVSRVLDRVGVDPQHGDPLVQFRAGRVTLFDGTVIERVGPVRRPWVVVER